MARGRRIALVTASAVLAVGALTAAGCGSDSSSSSDTSGGGSSLSGEIAGAGSSAQAAAQEAWRAGFQEANSGATVSYDPVGSGGGREQFVAGGIAFGGTDAALADERADGRQQALRRRGQPGRDPGLHLADRGRLQPAERQEPPALAHHAREDHEGPDHEVERPGDRRRQPRRGPADHGDHGRQPLGRVGHDGELPASTSRPSPRTSGPSSPTATGRSRAASRRRAPPVSSRPSALVRARSVTPTRARSVTSARRPSRSGPTTSARARRPPPRSSTSRRGPRTRARTCSPTT